MSMTIRKIVIVILLLISTIAIGGIAYIQSIKPQYSGTLELLELQNETRVYMDTYGIPHIYANNQLDAYRTLGYMHAQDRLWQMELMRRIAPGRLSEILGKELLKTDSFFVTLGIEEASIDAISKLDKESDVYKLSIAYLSGINQFIDEGDTPIEFTLVGVNKEHFELLDIYNVFGYMAFSFAMAQKTDPLLSSIQTKLGDAYLEDFDIKPNTAGTLIYNSKPSNDIISDLSSTISEVTKKLPLPAFIGSNSWVVASEKSATGNVLFANDPHIGFAQPAVWYEAHLVTPNHEIYGYHLAGVPFAMLGHNRDYAYGITMFQNDDIDFYRETNHPTDSTKYESPDGFQSYKTYIKTIKVKDEDDILLEVKKSRHGPIMNGIQNEILQESPIAMSWAYTNNDIEILEASYQLSHAKSMHDIKKAASLIHAPGLNIMYGDSDGNIAWWGTGKLYTHKPHVNTKLILDGANGEDDIKDYLDFENNPMAENPDWNYVYSANNQPDSIVNMLYPGYYLPEDRAKRIVQLLEKKNDWNKESFSKMIVDTKSIVATELVSLIVSILNDVMLSDKEQSALKILSEWNGDNNIEDTAPIIYQRLLYRILENTYLDELDETLFNQLLKTHLINRTIAKQLHSKNSIWWDDMSSKELKETRKDIFLISFKEAISSLETQLGSDMNSWQWGTVHTLEHPHTLGAVDLLKPYFNVGPFEVAGTESVINNMAFDFNDTGLYEVKAGPSTRRIIDFSDIENSWSILPTGQSGNPFSKHYSDQAEMYNKGEFRKMMLNKDEIIKTSTLITVQPKRK